MSARRPVVIAVLGVAVALLATVLGYTLYWFHASGQVRSHLEHWADTHRAAGWQVAWDDSTTIGFPWHLGLSLRHPAVTSPAGLHWQADSVDLWTWPLWPRTLTLETTGAQRLGWRDRDWNLSLSALTAKIAAGTLDASLHDLTGPDGMAIGDLGLSVASLPPRPDPSGHPASWRFAVSARDIGLPTSPVDGFAPSLSLIELSGRVMGPVPDAAPVAAIAGWSKQGGVLELDRVALDWSPLGLEGSGTAALDPQGQPLLALSTHIRGFDALLDTMARTGTLDPAASRATKTILGLMAKPDPRGRPAIAAPISVQDGQLYLGPARLVAVPAIPWADFTMP